uniref:17k protein n=13 Tax=Cereal yellow dwarf virus (isolate RPV) TaxID=2170100 RepID=A1YGZ0_BYDVN|nr:putative movement protein [Cereal yellow dwarf virus RPV]ABL67532.1 17k protein [Cereal yellow dwarf virus RPV]ABL67535.1 17k protein [Cereal yellow dwarf virus RPV]ABL67541.1 17k protein [Cereal yellow dwarf virus RPV]ABL67598.1 17k protein [Cereal yellow dwarf virus RPV]
MAMVRADADRESLGEGLLSERSQWLWSLPTAQPGAEDAEDQLVLGEEELQDSEEEAVARHLFSQRTHSRATPLEVSPSGRLYQTIRHSRMEYSRPTMSIRSQVVSYSSSARPLPQQPVPSLMNWTPIAKSLRSHQPTISSQSPKLVRGASQRR